MKEGKSCVQWLKECSESNIQSHNVNTIRSLAVRLGTRLSHSLFVMMFLTSEGKHMPLKFQNFVRLIRNLMSSTLNRHTYAVSNRITRLLLTAEPELANIKNAASNSKLVGNLAVVRNSEVIRQFETENKISIGSVLYRLFCRVILKMEAILSHPNLPDSYGLMMEAELVEVVKQLGELETKFNGIDMEINGFRQEYISSVAAADETLDYFLHAMEPQINQMWSNLGSS